MLHGLAVKGGREEGREEGKERERGREGGREEGREEGRMCIVTMSPQCSGNFYVSHKNDENARGYYT